MIIIPLSHESGEVQRTPYVTLAILGLNVLFFVLTAMGAPGNRERIEELGGRLFEYYMAHPYLRMPEETLAKLPEEHRKTLQHIGKVQSMLGGLGTGGETSLSDEEIAGQQERLEQLARSFDRALEENAHRKYGYIPARGGVFTLITSMFMHGGFLHLLFNMLFLWLTGGVIEDIWGRVLFPAFYILGGGFAALVHAAMFPESTIPLVGASGAIAALMGAFMIRMYKTRIYFFYMFFFIGIRKGNFYAPAYAVLPLWLLQQFWQAYKASVMNPGGGGVAFWAHIGGFLFGAAVALGIKYFGVEERYIAPAIERKTNLVDANYSSGSRKLREGDLDGAVQDLRQALLKDPGNAMAHGELSRAYFRQGKERGGNLEFNRAVGLFLDQGLAEAAADEYQEVAEAHPEARLAPERHMAVARAMEEADMAEAAARAYRGLFDRYRDGETEIPAGLAKEGLERAARLFRNELDRPREAAGALAALFKTFPKMPAAERENVKKEWRAAETLARKREKSDAMLAKQVPEEAAPPAAETTAPEPPSRDVPLAKRIRPIPPSDGPPRYTVPSVAPLDANKVTAVPGGLDLHRLSEEPLPFAAVYAICVFQLAKAPPGRIDMDLFVGGKARPYRIGSNRVHYAGFLSKSGVNSLENFRRFVIAIVSRMDSVHLDPGTVAFLKSGKVRVYADAHDLERHEKRFWGRLMGEARSACGACGEVYWIDGRKVPPTGARSRCKGCGGQIHVRGAPAA